MKLGFQEQATSKTQSHEQQVQHSQIRLQQLKETEGVVDTVSDTLKTIDKAISRPRGSISLISEALKILGHRS
jgi:hypothetical protein